MGPGWTVEDSELYQIKWILFKEIIIINLSTGWVSEKRAHIDYRSVRGAEFLNKYK